jgi:hypothetical protein
MLGTTQAEILAAVDENGLSLVDDNNRYSSYYGNGSMKGFNTYGNLQLNRTGAATPARTIKSLKARVGILLLSGTVPDLVVDNPLEVKGKTFAGRTMQVDFGKLAQDPNNKEQYVLDVTVRKQGAGDGEVNDYNWTNTVWGRFDLFDADGNKYEASYPNVGNNNGATVQMTIPFTTTDRRTGKKVKVGPPARLVVNEWLSVTHEVTFEFKDIPLP